MLYKELQITGVINVTTLHDGLVSLVKEPKKILAILINFSATEGNVLEGWIGTERVLAIYDYLFDSQELTGADTFPHSTSKIIRIPLNIEIPPGDIFKVGIRCGGTANNVYGAYEYEIIS